MALSEREREELRRGTRLPLILVIVTLVVAVLLPRFSQRRVARLRDEINNLADPARLRVTGIQLDLALQGAQRRGYLLTGDKALATEFQQSRERRVREEKELLVYALRLDRSGQAGLTANVSRLTKSAGTLDSAVAASADVSAGALDAQHDAFVDIQRLSDSLATKIDSLSAARRTAIGRTENLVALTTAGLLLLGLAAAFLVARLGARFRLLALRLEERHAELARVTESRTRLVRGFTHDVKNPLGAADGYLALLEDGIIPDVTPRQLDIVGRVRRSIKQALELIAHLLDIARAEAGQLEIRPRPTCVSDEVREVADAFAAQAKAKNLEMKVAVESDLPTIETDPPRLRQVVGNLISNAVKYTPNGGHIEVRACLAQSATTRNEREIEIVVTDDGPGIAADKLSSLFTEFTRFDPGAAEGAGIGLAISKKIAQALGGDITVKTEAGQGASFVLHLPIGDAAESPSA